MEVLAFGPRGDLDDAIWVGDSERDAILSVFWWHVVRVNVDFMVERHCLRPALGFGGVGDVWRSITMILRSGADGPFGLILTLSTRYLVVALSGCNISLKGSIELVFVQVIE